MKTIVRWRAVDEEGLPWNKEEMARPDGRRPASHRLEGWVVSAVSELGGMIYQLS